MGETPPPMARHSPLLSPRAKRTPVPLALQLNGPEGCSSSGARQPSRSSSGLCVVPLADCRADLRALDGALAHDDLDDHSQREAVALAIWIAERASATGCSLWLR